MKTFQFSAVPDTHPDVDEFTVWINAYSTEALTDALEEAGVTDKICSSITRISYKEPNDSLDATVIGTKLHMEPQRKGNPLGLYYYAIAGRALFDGEDSCLGFGPCTETKACELFEKEMLKGASLSAIQSNEEDGTPMVLINCVISSVSPIFISGVH